MARVGAGEAVLLWGTQPFWGPQVLQVYVWDRPGAGDMLAEISGQRRGLPAETPVRRLLPPPESPGPGSSDSGGFIPPDIGFFLLCHHHWSSEQKKKI